MKDYNDYEALRKNHDLESKLIVVNAEISLLKFFNLMGWILGVGAFFVLLFLIRHH